MHICLIDAYSAGHHESYLVLYSGILLAQGHAVTCLCESPNRVRALVEESAEGATMERFKTCGLCAPKPRNQGRFLWQIEKARYVSEHWKMTGQRVRELLDDGLKIDLFFFMYLDSYLGGYLPMTMIDRLFPWPWVGIYMTPNHLRYDFRFPWLRKEMFSFDYHLKSKNCRGVAVLDEGIQEALRDRILGKPVVTLPDVAEISESADKPGVVSEILRRSAGRPVVLLIGMQSVRKGSLVLLEAAHALLKEDVFVAWVGETVWSDSAPEQNALKSFETAHPNDCLVHLERIPDEGAFNSILNTCDVLFLAYQKFPHSSNLMTKAAHFEKPVIVSDGHCMAERVRRYGIGTTVAEGNSDAAIQGIRSLLQTPPSDIKSYENYFHDHSKESLTSKLKTFLQKTMRIEG